MPFPLHDPEPDNSGGKVYSFSDKANKLLSDQKKSREKDFIRITEKDIIDIFNQTSISKGHFHDLKAIVQGEWAGDSGVYI